MARITIQAVHEGKPRRSTFSERVVAENLDSDHYVTLLLERLSWGTSDPEALESQSADLAADHDDDARHTRVTIRSRRDDASLRLGSRPLAADRRVRA
jgi:hypothetical protein